MFHFFPIQRYLILFLLTVFCLERAFVPLDGIIYPSCIPIKFIKRIMAGNFFACQKIIIMGATCESFIVVRYCVHAFPLMISELFILFWCFKWNENTWLHAVWFMSTRLWFFKTPIRKHSKVKKEFCFQRRSYKTLTYRVYENSDLNTKRKYYWRKYGCSE